jgi:hypothetical protein
MVTWIHCFQAVVGQHIMAGDMESKAAHLMVDRRQRDRKVTGTSSVDLLPSIRSYLLIDHLVYAHQWINPLMRSVPL